MEGQLPTVPAAGKVAIAGNTGEGLELIFHPVNPDKKWEKQPKPSARVNSDGTFKVRTYTSDDGAPEGEYTVTVSFSANNPQEQAKDGRYGSDDAEVDPKLQAQQKAWSQSKYANPSLSTLKVKVEKGKPDLGTLELK